MKKLQVYTQVNLFYIVVFVGEADINPFHLRPIRWGPYGNEVAIRVYPPTWFERVVLKRTLEDKKDGAVKRMKERAELLEAEIIDEPKTKKKTKSKKKENK